MKRMLPLVLLCTTVFNLKSISQATSPFTSCPDVNIAVARSGVNADVNNPFYLYNVNQATGVMTLMAGGPFKDPSDATKNLQVNGIGISRKDGYVYGFALEGTMGVQRFVRMDKNYGVTNLGIVDPPVSTPGMIGVVNHAAGDMDTAGNFYFTAVTINPFNSTPTLDRFFIGKIGRADTITTAPVAPIYYEIEIGSISCAAYLNSLFSDPNNSGLKDMVYNAVTKSFFGYATYKLAGAPNFSGQVIEIVQQPNSVPAKYTVLCNSVVNSHNTETAGTLVDKLGKTTVLFTDGSFGMLNRNESGSFTGTYTQIAASTGLPNPLRADMASCGHQAFPDPPTYKLNCPDANVAVLREGTNNDSLKLTYVYNVNSVNGTFTQLPGGHLVYPDNPLRPLHVNGVGVNKADGFMYGLALDQGSASAKLVRFDYKYGVHIIGSVTPPAASASGIGLINTAAGDMDRLNGYYFTALTVKPDPNNGLPMIEKFFIGRIPEVSTLTSSTVAPQYNEVELGEAACAGWLNSIITDPNNSGLKDLVYSPFTSTIYAYATWKPAGSPGFVGQLVEFRPILGSLPVRYRVYCNGILNNHNAETSGALIDKLGNFIVMLTDGTVGKIQSTGNPLNYNGVYAPLNNNTGLPNPQRGDLASCGEAEGAVPVRLISFTGKETSCRSIFNWSSDNEINFSHYELEQSFDNFTFNSVAKIEGRKTLTRNNYSFNIVSSARYATYRLKMVDLTGKVSYSPIVGVTSNCKGVTAGFIVNPNPVESVLNLHWYGIAESTSVFLKIYDAYGRELKSQLFKLNMGNPLSGVNVNDLPAGNYFVRVTGKNINVKQGFVKR